MLLTRLITSSTSVSDLAFYYLMRIERDGRVISPFHDVPLHPGTDKAIVNMVVEIPRWTNAKLEVSSSVI